MVLVMPFAKIGPTAMSRANAIAAGQQRVGRNEPVEEAPALALFAAHRAAGVKQLARAPLADQARQDRAGAHVAAREADAVEQEGGLAARRAQPQVRGHRHDRACACANAVDRGDDRLRAGAHRLHQIAGHAREHQQLGRLQPNQRADDLVHVTARAEVVAGADQHDGMHVGRVLERAEQVAQLGIRVEGQRVLAVGAIQCEGCDAVAHLPLEMRRAVAEERLAVAGDQRRVDAVGRCRDRCR